MSKDPFTEDERSEIMRSVGNVDTEPEMCLRKRLWSEGLRYRVHEKVAGTKPDLVFRGSHVAVFVDGCFWHGCPEHYRAPKNNAEYWRNKIEGNRSRDERDNSRLREANWTVIRVWECQVQNELDSVVAAVKEAVF